MGETLLKEVGRPWFDIVKNVASFLKFARFMANNGDHIRFLEGSLGRSKHPRT